MTNLLHTTLRKTRRRTKNVVAWLGSCTQWQHSLSHIMFKTGKEMRKALHYLKATLGHKLGSLPEHSSSSKEEEKSFVLLQITPSTPASIICDDDTRERS